MKWQFLPKREVNLLCAVFYYFLIYARLFLIHEKQFPKVRKMKKSVVFWTHVFKVKVFVMFTIENSEVIGSWTKTNKGNNKITELRTILQRESQNS
jgi:hypothetical protein